MSRVLITSTCYKPRAIERARFASKTHLYIGLEVETTRKRYRVLFTRAANLVRSLLEARDERTLSRVQQLPERLLQSA